MYWSGALLHHSIFPLFRLSCYLPQVIERKNACGVSISPRGLDSVCSDPRQASELKGLRGQRTLRAFVQVPQDVFLAPAAGAGTMPPQFLQRDEAFAAVLPFDRQLLADRLDVHWSHGDNLGHRLPKLNLI